MEAFGDAVVPGEAPHQGNFRLPRAQSLPQLDELSQTGVAQLVQGVQKLADKRDGLFARAVLDQEQVGKFLLEAVDLSQDGELREVMLEFGALFRLEDRQNEDRQRLFGSVLPARAL